MKILALEKELPGVDPGQFSPFLQAEALQAWKMVRTGTIREMYFNTQNHTAVIILECSDMDEARAALATLPLVQSGLIEFEIIPLAPYDGFQRLFGADPAL